MKSILITGANRGLGLKVAQIFSDNGYTAYRLAHWSINHCRPGFTSVFVGSIAGEPGFIPAGCAPYGAYKGTLKLISEAIRSEGGTSHYLNLGSFRDYGDDIKQLSTNSVSQTIFEIVEDPTKFEPSIDLITATERASFFGQGQASASP